MLPDFLIIGAEKAGTTWLHDILREHPALFLPDVKEVHFFNRFDSNGHETDNFAHRDLAWYARHFAKARHGQLISEATPMYICDAEAPVRIRATLPEARFVVLLRNPVLRAWSHYRMAQAKQHTELDFGALIERRDARFLLRGLYARQLAHWFDLFPRERFLILFSEEITRCPAAGLGELAAWLQIAPDPLLAASPEAPRNAATAYRSPAVYNASVRAARALRNFPPTRRLAAALKISGLYDAVKAANKAAPPAGSLQERDRAALVAFYREDVLALGRLLDRPSLPWPDFRAKTP